MRRFFRYSWGVVTLSCLVLLVVSQGGSVTALSRVVWANSSVVTLSNSEQAIPSAEAQSCAGEVSLIFIRSWSGLREACVFGGSDGAQVARFVGSSGVYVYAVKFPLDAAFIPVKDMCLNAIHCVYGQGEDVLLLQIQQATGLSTALVEDFTQHLVKYTDDGTYYRLNYPSDWKYIKIGTRIAKTNAVGVSTSGKWAVVEVEGYGFVRVNLATLEYKRVTAPGAQYGYGADPSFELAISDDGTKLAVAGWRSSISVYEINDDCGDALTDASTLYFSPYTYACEAASINVYGLFPGFLSAHVPRFSRDATKLTSYVRLAGQAVRRVTIAPQALSNSSSEYEYVALGDSFTSGEGELADAFYVPATNSAGNRCHVSTRSYPYLVGASRNISTSNRACSGSRVANVGEASRLTATDNIAPSYISIGVGGNDVELMGKLKTCLGVGTCEWTNLSNRQASQQEIRAVFPKIVTLIKGMLVDHPDAAIALIGYPSVINSETNASCSPIVSVLLNSEERRYMDESIRYLNTVLRAAASYTGAVFIDTENALMGERLCDASEAAMNGVRLGDDIAPIPLLENIKLIGAESFHPTPRGHQLVAQSVRAVSTDELWAMGDCEGCLVSGAQLTPSSYWTTGAATPSVPKRQVSEPFLSDTVVRSGAELSFSFAPGSFKANTSVVFELHSTPTELGSFLVGSDGSLTGALHTPDGTIGYHAIHALGQSLSGEDIDVYQTIALEPLAAEVGVAPVVSNTSFPSSSASASMPSQVTLIEEVSNSGFSAQRLLTMPATVPSGTKSTVLGVQDERAKETLDLSVLVGLALGALSTGVAMGISWRKFRSNNTTIDTSGT